MEGHCIFEQATPCLPPTHPLQAKDILPMKPRPLIFVVCTVLHQKPPSQQFSETVFRLAAGTLSCRTVQRVLWKLTCQYLRLLRTGEPVYPAAPLSSFSLSRSAVLHCLDRNCICVGYFELCTPPPVRLKWSMSCQDLGGESTYYDFSRIASVMYESRVEN
jgi:hypothetical protein